MDRKVIVSRFIELFGEQPQVFSAPGRINLIGEHTDYNEGFVLPAAIDKEVVFAIHPNHLKKFRFFASDFSQSYETHQIKPAPVEFHWANYLLGVLAQFEKKGIKTGGVDCVFGGNIPVGAGLSSSAAIECGFAFGLNEIFETGFTKHQLVLMAQKAEHEYAGVLCGVMDQFACVFGQKGQAIQLDCRDYSHRYFPVKPDSYTLLLCDTLVKHELASSEYNIRRRECETGVSVLQTFDSKITALRDVSPDFLKAHASALDPLVYKRCKYIVEENLRVLDACDKLADNKLEDFGQLMYQSHEGLRTGYEVSCKELDILVDATLSMKQVSGARMMGGGFGGCTINLVETSFIEEFKKQIAKSYTLATGKEPAFYQIVVSDGVRRLNGD